MPRAQSKETSSLSSTEQGKGGKGGEDGYDPPHLRFATMEDLDEFGRGNTW